MSRLTIITATLNSMDYLPRLVKSLEVQTVKKFTWLIADGLSNDGTVEYLKDNKTLNISLESEKDFGVYDALNRAIQRCQSEYYLVLGADDQLAPDAIENYLQVITDSNPDFVASSWITNTKTHNPMNGVSWLHGMRAVASCHSVSLAIKKDLHLKYGFYSPYYPLCADQYFVRKSINGGASIKVGKFVAGEYASTGVSGTQKLHYLFDFFKCQCAVGENKLIQLMVFVFRFLKHFKSF